MTATTRSPLTPAEQQRLNDMAAGTFSQAVRFSFGLQEYLTGNLSLAYDPTPGKPGEYVWALTFGRYNAYTGYWIYAVPSGGEMQCVLGDMPQNNPPIVNKIGLLRMFSGSPEDWELFRFEIVGDPVDGAVHIRNLYGGYVRLFGTGFRCDGNAASAATFFVEF
jgi:hypothetical protein